VSAVDVLLPTCNRRDSLILTLAGIATQTLTDLRVVVADQRDVPQEYHPVVLTLRRLIEARGGQVEWHARPPVHGIAEQRDFLLRQARAEAALYLDDDVYMEPPVVERLLRTLRENNCGFVGAFGAGLSHRDDVRPHQQWVERWAGRVQPEVVEPGSAAWERWQFHRAANTYHVGRAQADDEIITYKVAWIGGCVLYDRAKLRAVGGFSFWPRLPRYHSGEEVLVQNLLMQRWGGCGILPAGTYFSEV